MKGFINSKVQTLPLTSQWVCLEDHVVEDIGSLGGILAEIVHGKMTALCPVFGNLVLKHGLLLRKTMLLCRGLHKQQIIGLGNPFGNLEIVPCLEMLGVLTKSRNQYKQSLRTTRTLGMRLLNPKFSHGEILLAKIDGCQHLVSLPHLFIPSTCIHTALLPLNCLIQLAHILQGLSQLEHVANIVGFLTKSLSQQANVPLLLIRLGTPIPNIVNPYAVHGFTFTTVPVLVGDTHALPRNRQLHEASVVVLKSSVLLNNSIATCSLELGMGILSLKNHVPIENQCIGLLQIPTQLLGLLLGRRKRQTAIVSKVLPLMLNDLRGLLRKGRRDLTGVVSGSRIADNDGIGILGTCLHTPLQDLAFVLYHQSQKHLHDNL